MPDYGLCSVCKTPRIARISRTAANPNRPFLTCPRRCKGSFAWLDTPVTDSRYTQSQVPLSRSTDVPTINPINERKIGGRSVERGGGTTTGLTTPIAGQPVYEDVPSVVETSTPPIAGPLSFLSRQAAPVSLNADHDGESDAPAGSSPQAAFVPSHYQAGIFDFVSTGEGHGMVKALAGSGKTSSVERAIAYTPKGAKVIYLAFNKRIVTEAEKRMPERCKTATTHSQAFSNLRRSMGGKVKVDDRKTYNLLRQIGERSSSTVRDVIDENGPVINQLVGLCKNTLADTDNDSLSRICDYYGIDVNGSGEVVYQATRDVLRASRDMRDVIDFDDMLLYSADGTVQCEQFDNVFIDEAQDLNKAQIEMVLRSVRPGGRIVAVGDENQSCYAFRGADIDAISNIVTALTATILPLSICYRCPTSHLDLARQIVPTIEARPNAPVGVIKTIGEGELDRYVQPGSMVICRTNAPLVRPAFDLIRRGIKAVIVGRDIGRGLGSLIRKVAKKFGITSITTLVGAVSDYGMREAHKLTLAHKDNQSAALMDQVETIIALSDGCRTIDELERKIDSVFSDDVRGIAFSSIHKAKGLESERVFLLHPHRLPHAMAKTDWAIKQEKNLAYIWLTRSKSDMFFVEQD